MSRLQYPPPDAVAKDLATALTSSAGRFQQAEVLDLLEDGQQLLRLY
jgi:hypothetical protein